jgi:hypothetical protein
MSENPEVFPCEKMAENFLRDEGDAVEKTWHELAPMPLKERPLLTAV